MKKGWKQSWKNLLFQHFEIQNISKLEKHLPKNCKFDSFEGKFYLGLVSMNMTNVTHKSIPNIVWFKEYNELNVRTYVIHDNKPCVLFLSLDVDSWISIFGARVFYGLPYRYAKYENTDQNITVKKAGKIEFQTEYSITSKSKVYPKNSFESWVTERYFFVNKHLGISFKGKISHKPWELCTAKVKNTNLSILDNYSLMKQHPCVLFCKQIDVETNQLERI